MVGMNLELAFIVTLGKLFEKTKGYRPDWVRTGTNAH